MKIQNGVLGLMNSVFEGIAIIDLILHLRIY